MWWVGLYLFALFNVLRKLSESPIVPFLVWIVSFPFFTSLVSVKELFIFGFVGFSLNMIRLIVRSKSFTWLWSTWKRLKNLGLMRKFIITSLISLIIIRTSDVVVRAEQQTSSGITFTFFHFGIIKWSQSQLYIALFVSRIVLLIIVVFLMLELWVPPGL